MLITDKAREEILYALSELPVTEAKRIAENNSVTPMTVYRYWKKIKENVPVEINDIIADIAEYALSVKPQVIKTHKRWKNIERQL